jgi:methyl-accepting chemotaxis protein
MRRSILRLVVSSVFLCWALAFVVMNIYVRSLSWTEVRARTDGVFLVHQLLDREPASRRPERLRELQPHSRVRFALATPDEVERRLARHLYPGETTRQEVSSRENWFFLMFADGAGALVAGPVDPAIPAGFVPVGAILLLALLPVIAALIAVRVERGLAKVERASRALASGELGARVDHSDGPSQELAVSFNAMAERVERLIRSRDELVQAVSHER